MVNDGSGPLRIVSMRVKQAGGKTFDSLVLAVTEVPSIGRGNIDGRALSPSKELDLFVLSPELGLTSIAHEVSRLELSRCEIVLEYTDVYGSKFPAFTKSLGWFHAPC